MVILPSNGMSSVFSVANASKTTRKSMHRLCKVAQGTHKAIILDVYGVNHISKHTCTTNISISFCDSGGIQTQYSKISYLDVSYQFMLVNHTHSHGHVPL